MYIKQVHIKNFRAIQELKMTFEKPAGWHVLIGDNGSGKSSVLQAIALAIIGPNGSDALRRNFIDYIQFGNEKRKSVEEAKARLIISEHDEPSHYFPNTERGIETNIKIIKEHSYRKTRGVIKATHPHQKAFTRIWGQEKSKGIPQFFSLSYGPFRNIGNNIEKWEDIYESNPRVAAHLSLFEKDVPLVNAIKWLSKLEVELFNNRITENDGEDARKTKEAAVSEIQKITSSISKFLNKGELFPASKVFNVSPFLLKDSNSSLIGIEQLSDGFKSVLAMALDIIWQLIQHYDVDEVFDKKFEATSKIHLPGVIMIDEIDAHLHPTWQTRIGQWFTKYFPNMQFIVTTHSPLICRASEKGTIWRLSNVASEQQIEEVKGLDKERLVSGNILDAYGTELFGKSSVVERSEGSHAKLERLGHLNALFAVGQIKEEEEKERRHLQKILVTDDPTGF